MKHLPSLLSVLIVALMIANYFAPFGDLDFAWQVRTGELIWKTGSLQPPEPFSYTIGGSHVPDFEWLYELLLYFVWSGFGFGGLKFVRVILVGGTLILLVMRLRRDGVRTHGIILALLAVTIVLCQAWNLRPFFCTTIGLLLLVGWLHDHCTGRKPLDWRLPMLMLLWGNVHPGVIAGQGILVAAIVLEWLQAYLPSVGVCRNRRPLTAGELRRLTVIGTAGLAASLICPDPLERLLYPFRPELRDPIQRIFAEMQPLHASFLVSPYTIGPVYVVAGLVLLTVILRFREYRLWEIVALGGVGFLGNAATRGVQDWLLIMLALGVPHLAPLLARAAQARRRRVWVAVLLRLDRSVKSMAASRLFRVQPFWPAAVAGCLLVISVIPPLSRGMPRQYDPLWPIGAVDHIDKHGLHGRFFGPPDYGALLIWRLPVDAKVYSDTRGFFYPPVFLEDSHYVPQLGPDWRRRLQRVLDEYKTDYFLLEATGARSALWTHVKGRIGTPLYQDEVSVLLSAEQIRMGVDQSFADSPQIRAGNSLENSNLSATIDHWHPGTKKRGRHDESSRGSNGKSR